jgi:hypothetical protein
MSGHAGSHPEGDERRRQAIVAFLGAGVFDIPSTALAVRALADARRSVAACQAHSQPAATWLAGQIRMPGIIENTATLASLELPEHRATTARAYAGRRPDRLAILQELLAALGI